MNFTERPSSKNLYNKKEIGMFGEDAAAKLLKKQGYTILERNYHESCGEIDIIALDKEYYCFVEVRLRKSNLWGTPSETIDYKKQQKIIKTAQLYSIKHNIYDSPMRFDVVVLNADFEKKKISSVEVIKDAFQL